MRFLEGRLGVVALVCFLFAVFAFGVAVREPYPAAVFPRFGSVPVDEEVLPVRFRLIEFESGDRSVRLTPNQVFDGAFDSFHNNMLDSLVAAGPAQTVDDPAFVDWVDERAETKLGWDCVDSLAIVEEVSDQSVPDRELQRFDLGGCR